VTDYSHIATNLIQNGKQIIEFREDRIDLESAFMALTKGMSSKVLEPGS